MVASMGLMNNVAPPRIESIHDTDEAKAEHKTAIAKLFGMHPHHQTEEHRQGRK